MSRPRRYHLEPGEADKPVPWLLALPYCPEGPGEYEQERQWGAAPVSLGVEGKAPSGERRPGVVLPAESGLWSDKG